MKFDEEKKLDEQSILKRLSNGAMLNVYGGQSSSSDEEVADPLSLCLAGCSCDPHRACTTCMAEI